MLLSICDVDFVEKMKIDYYKILGLNRNAGIDDVKKAYRSLAMQYHPDRNPEDESSVERFKLVTEAYEVLIDVKKRAKYDRVLSAFEFHDAEGVESGTDEYFIHEDEILRDFLRGYYNKQQSKKHNRQNGEDLRHNLRLTFNEAAKGVEKQIRIPGESQCFQCGGTGLKAGAKAIVCFVCEGRGRVRKRGGVFEACHKCKGSGAVVTGFCNRCNGSGVVLARRQMVINVPPGVETGTRMQIKGMGMPGSNGGKAGNLFVVVNVKKHPFFKKKNLDIICEVPLTFIKAIFGCMLEVPVLDGMKRIKIPSGTQSGKLIRLRGQGISLLHNSKRGDLIIRLIVVVPEKVSREDRKVLRELEKSICPKNYPAVYDYFRKLEKFNASGNF